VSVGSTSVPGDGAAPDAAPVPSRSFGAALGLTVLGAVLPGTALLAAGRRRLGFAALAVFVALVAGGIWLATAGRRTAIRAALHPGQLVWVVVGVGVVALLWVLVILAGYRLLVPPRPGPGRHLLGGFVVLLLVAAVVVPAVDVGRLALIQRGLISGIFTGGRSATVVDKPDPFGDKERVNVLLLGGDGGKGREGVRTDTVIVASVDTHTGNTALISLPRNLENLPFPPGSPLAAAYPHGFQAPTESEGLLNALYRNGPILHPGILGPTDHPGADMLKLGIGQATGLTIDYFVLINLDGFSRLVDALGGITLNVNYYVPIGGEPTLHILPDAYIAPGPNQHMNGARALDFTRGRFGLTDYLRMARQRCVIQAIVEAADPVTLVQKYQQLADTTKDIVSTDIPQSALDSFVDLALRVKNAQIRSLVFDASVINPAYPDYDRIRALVADAVASPSAATGSAAPTATASASSSAAPTTGAVATTGSAKDPVTDLKDACVYDPVQAAKAIAAGEPPTRRR
jgi:polyisoprenyl-teichoic acid--peptidoglycan teichoic acid transferase